MSVGQVESVVRVNVRVGESLPTPSGRGRFSVAEYRSDVIVLLLGAKEAWTPLPWKALESIPTVLRGRDWVRIGGAFEVEADPDTLDGHLKGYMQRATAGWVAVVLERAGVVEIDRARPARVRLMPGW